MEGNLVGTATAGTWAVLCGSCPLNWTRGGPLADYERQAIESKPCPACGAYTLSCAEPRSKAARHRPEPRTRRAG